MYNSNKWPILIYYVGQQLWNQTFMLIFEIGHVSAIRRSI
jgi:hypothetical protein